MIERYRRPEMARLWSEDRRLRYLLRAEWAYMAALAPAKKIPGKEIAALRRAIDRIDPREVREREKKTRHETVAMLELLAERVAPEAPKAARFLHYGATSNDLLDTALSMQIVDALEEILRGWKGLMRRLRRLASAHAETWMVGRSHGVHAEPLSFGFKLAGWHAEAKRSLVRLEAARETCRFGKFSGAVGAFSQSSPEVERGALRRLGLKPEPVATQVVPRDRHAECLGALALAAAAIERWATEIRHLQRTEVLELEESFRAGQKGSSAMPHKRNPVLCENLCGLARMVRSTASTAMENIVLWHERDISHSSVERVHLPDAAMLLDFMIHRMAGVLDGLVVNGKAMRRNLEASNGLVFSQNVLLALVDRGMSRADAYAVVQKAAMRCWKSGRAFRGILAKDAEIRRRLGAKGLADCFDLKRYRRHLREMLRRGGVR